MDISQLACIGRWSEEEYKKNFVETADIVQKLAIVRSHGIVLVLLGTGAAQWQMGW